MHTTAESKCTLSSSPASARSRMPSPWVRQPSRREHTQRDAARASPLRPFGHTHISSSGGMEPPRSVCPWWDHEVVGCVRLAHRTATPVLLEGARRGGKKPADKRLPRWIWLDSCQSSIADGRRVGCTTFEACWRHRGCRLHVLLEDGIQSWHAVRLCPHRC